MLTIIPYLVCYYSRGLTDFGDKNLQRAIPYVVINCLEAIIYLFMLERFVKMLDKMDEDFFINPEKRKVGSVTFYHSNNVDDDSSGRMTNTI